MTESISAVVLGLVVAVGVLVALAAAAMTWGVDTRDLFADDPAG